MNFTAWYLCTYQFMFLFRKKKTLQINNHWNMQWWIKVRRQRKKMTSKNRYVHMYLTDLLITSRVEYCMHSFSSYVPTQFGYM